MDWDHFFCLCKAVESTPLLFKPKKCRVADYFYTKKCRQIKRLFVTFDLQDRSFLWYLFGIWGPETPLDTVRWILVLSFSNKNTSNVLLFVRSKCLPLLLKVLLFSSTKEKAPLSFAFDFDLVDFSTGIPLDPEVFFLETSCIQILKRKEVSQGWKGNIRNFSIAGKPWNIDAAKWFI